MKSFFTVLSASVLMFTVAAVGGLLDDEDGQAPVSRRRIGVGAGQDHQGGGLAGEGAPGLGAVDHEPAGDRRRGDLQTSDIGTEVGFGHRNGTEGLSRCEPGEPMLLLFLGAAGLDGPGEDLAATGDLDMFGGVAIVGIGEGVVIDGNFTDRIFDNGFRPICI